MRQLPALFSTEMVKALLEGIKTMTRRIKGLEKVNECPDEWNFVCIGSNPEKEDDKTYHAYFQRIGTTTWMHCKPQYQVGDQIWVKETHRISFSDKAYWNCEFKDETIISKYYKSISLSTNNRLLNRKSILKWTPSMFLPKDFTRIWLECTGVRCERLLDITEADAKAEGAAEWNPARDMKYLKGSKSNLPKPCGPFKFSFILLWCKINGVESFDLNPWVFIYEFKRIEKP